MASPTRTRHAMTLEEFLKLPEEKPSLEFIDGRIEAKDMPEIKHSVLTVRLSNHLNQFAEPLDLGLAVPELRCSFAGRSVVPDVAFLLYDHVPETEDGNLGGQYFLPADIHVEIISPDRTVRRSHEKLIHATSHGCPLGWLIHPEKKTVDVYRPNAVPERLPDDGSLTGEPVLPGYQLAVAELFGWLRRGPRRNVPQNPIPTPGADPG